MVGGEGWEVNDGGFFQEGNGNRFISSNCSGLAQPDLVEIRTEKSIDFHGSPPPPKTGLFEEMTLPKRLQ